MSYYSASSRPRDSSSRSIAGFRQTPSSRNADLTSSWVMNSQAFAQPTTSLGYPHGRNNPVPTGYAETLASTSSKYSRPMSLGHPRGRNARVPTRYAETPNSTSSNYSRPEPIPRPLTLVGGRSGRTPRLALAMPTRSRASSVGAGPSSTFVSTKYYAGSARTDGAARPLPAASFESNDFKSPRQSFRGHNERMSGKPGRATSDHTANEPRFRNVFRDTLVAPSSTSPGQPRRLAHEQGTGVPGHPYTRVAGGREARVPSYDSFTAPPPRTRGAFETQGYTYYSRTSAFLGHLLPNQTISGAHMLRRKAGKRSLRTQVDIQMPGGTNVKIIEGGMAEPKGWQRSGKMGSESARRGYRGSRNTAGW